MKARLPFVEAGDMVERFVLGRNAAIMDADGDGVHYAFGATEFR